MPPAYVQFTTLVPAFNVRFVVVPICQTEALFPVNVHVPLPMVRVRVFALFELNKKQVTFLLFASKLPRVSVRLLDVTKSSTNEIVALVPLIINEDANAFPFEVIEPTADAMIHCSAAVTELVMADDKTKFVAKAIVVDVDDHVPENPVKFNEGSPVFVPCI